MKLCPCKQLPRHHAHEENGDLVIMTEIEMTTDELETLYEGQVRRYYRQRKRRLN